MLSKSVLRQAFRTNLSRDDHDAKALAHAYAQLNTRLADFLRHQHGIWAAFEPLGFEADIRPAVAASAHLTFAYPRIEHESLKFYSVTSRDQLLQNQFHIWEPDPTRAKHIHPDEFRGMLIPGLAFDHHGNRLGRGRGFYDRALAEILTTNQPLKIGIALDRQVSEQELPHDNHDIAMDLVLTESRILGAQENIRSGASVPKGQLS